MSPSPQPVAPAPLTLPSSTLRSRHPRGSPFPAPLLPADRRIWPVSLPRPPRPYAGTGMGAWGHLPLFILIRCGSLPSAPLPHASVPPQGSSAHQLPAMAWMAGVWSLCLGSRPALPQACGPRAPGRWTGEERRSHPPTGPNQHTPSAHSPHSLPDCQASGPGGTRKVGEQPLPPGCTRARAWTPECGAARLGHRHPLVLPGKTEVPGPRSCVRASDTLPAGPILPPRRLAGEAPGS